MMGSVAGQRADSSRVEQGDEHGDGEHAEECGIKNGGGGKLRVGFELVGNERSVDGGGEGTADDHDGRFLAFEAEDRHEGDGEERRNEQAQTQRPADSGEALAGACL